MKWVSSELRRERRRKSVSSEQPSSPGPGACCLVAAPASDKDALACDGVWCFFVFLRKAAKILYLMVFGVILKIKAYCLLSDFSKIPIFSVAKAAESKGLDQFSHSTGSC